MQTERVYCPVLSVNPSSICTFSDLVSGPRPSKQLETYKENFKKNQHNDKISKIAAKKISLALDYIIYVAKPKTIPEGYKGAGNQYKLAFVTLSLSAKQIHTDKEIITNCLQPLLNYFRKHYKLENYVWRAEKQKNGNIHFHIVLDKWIPYQDLRFHWNLYQQNLGYITRYSEAQKKFHNQGFRLHTSMLKTWSEDRQKQAYDKGYKENWNNPNSIDIHSTKRIRNLKKYLCKYLTKQPHEKIDEDEINNTTASGLLSIDSRLWACSEQLSNLRGARSDIDFDTFGEIERIRSTKGVKTIISDYFTVTFIELKQLNEIEFPIVTKLFREYIELKFPT
jgi:hypothetical protein